MSNINNKNGMVYVVFKDTDDINIEAVFAKRESLQRYLGEQRIQFENSLNDGPCIPEIHRVKTLGDEEYEIRVDTPTLNIEVMYSEIDAFVPNSTQTSVKIWVANCICPFRQVKVFTSKEKAKEWMSALDDPEEFNFVEEHELL